MAGQVCIAWAACLPAEALPGRSGGWRAEHGGPATRQLQGAHAAACISTHHCQASLSLPAVRGAEWFQLAHACHSLAACINCSSLSGEIGLRQPLHCFTWCMLQRLQAFHHCHAIVPFPTLGTGPCCSPVDDCCNAPHISFCCRAPSAPETGRHGFMTARPTMFRVVDTPRFAGRTPKSSAAAAFRAAAAASGRTQVVLDDRLLRLGLLFRAPFMRRFLLESRCAFISGHRQISGRSPKAPAAAAFPTAAASMVHRQVTLRTQQLRLRLLTSAGFCSKLWL